MTLMQYRWQTPEALWRECEIDDENEEGGYT